MLVGVWQDSLIVRVGPDDYEKSLLEPDVTSSPVHGRKRFHSVSMIVAFKPFAEYRIL